MDTVSTWFSMDYEFTYSLMRLDLDPLENLPIQKRRERARRQDRVDRLFIQDGPRYEVVDTPYKMGGRPVHDLQLNTSLPTSRQLRGREDRRRNVPQSNSYDLRGAGDLFYTNAYWSIAGSEIHPIAQARLHFERQDPGGNLLGEMEATEVRGGDIDGRPRAVAEYELGLLDQLAVAGRINTMPLRDGRQRLYATGSVRNSFSRLYTSVDLTIGRGLATQGVVQTRIKNFNFVADSAFFFADFESEQYPMRTHSIRNSSRIRLNGMLSTPESLRIPFSLTLSNDHFGGLGNRTHLSHRLSKRAAGINFVHSGQIQRQPTGNFFSNGTFTARRRSRIVSPHGQVSYSVDQGVRLYRLGASWRINNDALLHSSFTHERNPSRGLVRRLLLQRTER